MAILLVMMAGCTVETIIPTESSDSLPTATVEPTVEVMAKDVNKDSVTPSAAPSSTPPPAYSLAAFPSAEGFGAKSAGGRGGRVIAVTTLADNGLGSLREAIEAKGARIVIFQVGGTIELREPLIITNPYITIAGQTAPGDGITLKNHPSNGRSPLKIETHDVIIRYLRSRPGPSKDEAGSLDALDISGGHNIIIDHVSLSWATDEVISTWYAPHNISIQWSIIAEGLYDSTHEEGAQSNGMLLGSEGSERISIHHNLFAHNDERNPRIKTSGIVDVVNNVIYNPGFTGNWGPSHITGDYTVVPVNFVGNYLQAGSGSGSADYLISIEGPASVYLADNHTPRRHADETDARADVVRPTDWEWIVERPHFVPAVTTVSAENAYDWVLAEAGANAGLDCDGNFYPRRDAVDERIISDVVNGTGERIDDPDEVGGWPKLKGGEPCTDSDGDGMPDGWERSHCLDAESRWDGSADSDRDGYTNVEEYLNGSHDVVPDCNDE